MDYACSTTPRWRRFVFQEGFTIPTSEATERPTFVAFRPLFDLPLNMERTDQMTELATGEVCFLATWPSDHCREKQPASRPIAAALERG